MRIKAMVVMMGEEGEGIVCGQGNGGMRSNGSTEMVENERHI